MDVDLSKVSLDFTPDLHYLYTSTLDYVEPGSYRLERGVLFTLPTGADESATRKVRVEKLDSVNLHILMNDDGKLRQLQFVRVDMPDGRADQPKEDALLDTFGIDTTTYELDSTDLEGLDFDAEEHHDHDHE